MEFGLKSYEMDKINLTKIQIDTYKHQDLYEPVIKSSCIHKLFNEDEKSSLEVRDYKQSFCSVLPSVEKLTKEINDMSL